MAESTAFSARLNEVKAAMQREDWATAIKAIEEIGPIPEKFQAITHNIVFYLYVSRNEFAKLSRSSGELQPQRAKDAVAALLLLRNRALEYPVTLPGKWSIDGWEKAVATHARAGSLEPKEVRLCLFFLAVLNRPALLEQLHFMALGAGEDLEDQVVAVVIRCFLRHKWYAEARRFLWMNNSRGIGFARFSFLIDRAEKSETPLPDDDDKFLSFLRYRFGTNVPATPAPGA